MEPTHARDRFAEGLALARKAWSEPGPFRWDGDHYQFDIVNPWPISLQKPHPPIWVCGVGSPSTMDMCAREDIGYMGVNTNVGHADFVGQCEFFRSAAEKYGREYDPSKIGWLCQVHVADTDQQALDEFYPHAGHGGLLTRGFAGPFKTFFPPGHMPPEALAAWERQTRATATGKSAVERDAEPLFGSPATVAERLIRRLRDYKIGNVVIAFQWGSMPQDMVLHSMRLFAEEVMPLVREELDTYLDELYPNRTQSETVLQRAGK
jgi:alkanesulfonate monooxygenase SsuD/methylene tetrahydromethanopterin reductase-like flavin-dependent oxidoreductase (luciferase family)